MDLRETITYALKAIRHEIAENGSSETLRKKERDLMVSLRDIVDGGRRIVHVASTYPVAVLYPDLAAEAIASEMGVEVADVTRDQIDSAAMWVEDSISVYEVLNDVVTAYDFPHNSRSDESGE